MGGAVERQAALVAGCEVGLVGEDGAGTLGAAAAGEGGGEFDFEVDEQGAGSVEEQIAGFGALDGASAEGKDEGVLGGEAGDGGVFDVAEGGLAVAGEDFGDGHAGFGLDDVVNVEEAPAEARGEERADGAFAGAHEAGEDNEAGSGGAGCGGIRSGQGSLLTAVMCIQYRQATWHEPRTLTMALVVMSRPPVRAAVGYTGIVMRLIAIVPLAATLLGITGCGYHTLDAATHLPPDAHTLYVPEFAIKTDGYHTEEVMTQAVIREFEARTRLRVTPAAGGSPDAVLHGTILQETVAPLTYNTTTQQSSSFLITVVVAVTLTGRDGQTLYENPNYIFRQQYQSTTDLPTFLDESPAAVQRLSRDFARALVADVLEGM